MDALEIINKLIEDNYDRQNQRPILLDRLKTLHTPTPLKIKTDKDGRTIWTCPHCGKTLVKFWSDVETINPHNYCWDCGQRLEWRP